MSKSLKQRARLHAEMSAENPNKGDFSDNTELKAGKQYKDTPIMVWNREGKHFATLGQHRITEPKETEKEVLQELDEQGLNLLLALIATIVDQTLTLLGLKTSEQQLIKPRPDEEFSKQFE